MMGKFVTSLYLSHIETERFPNIHNLKVAIFNSLKQRERDITGKGFALYEDDMSISFYIPNTGRVKIIYKINFIPNDKTILLSFYPVSGHDEESKDPKYWRKRDNVLIAKKVLEFADILGDSLEVNIEDYGSLKFERAFYEDYIDISQWNVKIFESSILSLEQTLSDWRYIYAQMLKKSQESKYIFVLFSSILFSNDIDAETKEKCETAIRALKTELKKFGRVEDPYDSLKFKYILEGYPPSAKLIAFFVENDDIISKVYKNFKRYLDVKGIPSQFVSLNTINEKFRFPKVKLNFLLEIFSKAEENKPLFLESTRSTSKIDGVLCLSDIKDASRINQNRLFGALFMYTFNKYEEIHIYEDINYKIRKGQILFEPGYISRLADYVYHLGGPEKLKIDIFLTRPWKEKDLIKFIEELTKKGYEINKVYYISTMRSRAVDEVILNNPLKQYEISYRISSSLRREISEYWHFYKILSETVAIIRTSTQLRIYPTLFNIYVQLMWPKTDSLSREDIEKIIWFTKKRLYRFQEFFVTKIPEPIWIFKNLRKMYLGEIKETVRIPLRLMI